MIYAEAPNWVVDSAVIIGSLLTLFTFLGVVSRSRPGRWLARKIAGDIRAWFGEAAEDTVKNALDRHRDEREDEMVEVLDEYLPRHLKPVLYELRTNGGGSFRDDTVERLDRIDRHLDRFATFMDMSTMDRQALRKMIEDHIERSQDWLRDREDDSDPPPEQHD